MQLYAINTRKLTPVIYASSEASDNIAYTTMLFSFWIWRIHSKNLFKEVIVEQVMNVNWN